MIPRCTSARLITAFAIAIALSACSGTEGGSASAGDPTTSTQQSASASSSGDGANRAPGVSNPLDVSGLENDPCAALSDADLSTLSLQPGTRDTSNSRPMCAYKYASDASSQIHVILDTNLSNGLSDIYARESGLAYFEPTTVSDYPAVYAGSTDDRANGVCELHIGVTDSVAVTLIAYLSPGTSDYPRGCEVAELTAKTMIENLKGGS